VLPFKNNGLGRVIIQIVKLTDALSSNFAHSLVKEISGLIQVAEHAVMLAILAFCRADDNDLIPFCPNRSN